MFSQVEIKRLYRLLLLREYLLTLNTSGLYSAREVTRAAKAINIRYNTLKSDISFFSGRRLIFKNSKCIKLHTLTDEYKKVYELFVSRRTQIEESKSPGIFLSDLYKTQVMRCKIIRQAYREAEKIDDKNNRRDYLRKVYSKGNSKKDIAEVYKKAEGIEDKEARSRYLKIVRGTVTPIGANLGINVSVSTIARFFGRSKTTAWKYIERLNKHELVTRIRNERYVCDVSELAFARSAGLFGRIKVRDNKVYERMQNSYVFIK